MPLRLSHFQCGQCLLIVTATAFDLQIHDEARKFSYQTGVKVVVAYGGAPINQQVFGCSCQFFFFHLIFGLSFY